MRHQYRTAKIPVKEAYESDSYLEAILKSHMSIEQIAVSLSRINRYGGKGLYPYNVAQHSVLVSMMTQPWAAMSGLLHDIHDCDIGDTNGLFKETGRVFKSLFKNHEATFSDLRLDMIGHIDDRKNNVNACDFLITTAEMNALNGEPFCGGKIIINTKQYGMARFPIWSSEKSAIRFMRRFYELDAK